MSRTYSAKDFKFLVLKKKKKPYIMVEGKDDIAFYENIVESIDRDYAVKPIGRYKNTSNCTAVIEWMQELDEVLEKDEHRKYFLGIIDGDARKYIDALPTENSLLYVLEYYSWESYFVNKEVVFKSIKNFLKTRRLVTNELIEYLYAEHIENHLSNELWFCALKRLRDFTNDEKCNQDNSIKRLRDFKNDEKCNQDNSMNRLDKDSQFIEELTSLKEELTYFSNEKNIIYTPQLLLEITKGKWALDFFVKKYLQALKKLPVLCQNDLNSFVKKCDYCENNDVNNCLYELKANYREEHIKADIINLIDLSLLQPIKERLKQLK